MASVVAGSAVARAASFGALIFAAFFSLNSLACVSAENVAESVVAPQVPGGVRVLTDETFEIETQAASGQTSGDWFVKFYAPWCRHCREMEPAWQNLAKELAGIVNVAELDATTSPQSARRFNIRGFPTLLFFKDRKMYEYKGERSVDMMRAFATGGWEDAPVKDVPPPITWFALFKEQVKGVFQELSELFLRSPAPMLLLLCIGVVGGFILCCVFFTLCEKSETKEVVVTRHSKKKD